METKQRPPKISANGRPLAAPADIMGPAQTRGYENVDHRWWKRPRDLPPFTFLSVQAMLLEPTVRLGLAMREAQILNASLAHREGENWIPGVRARRPEVAAFVEQQHAAIWKQIDALTTDQVWGWSAAEVCYRLAGGRVVFDRFLRRHANDTRAIIARGEVVGVRFLRVKDAPDERVDLYFPKCVFHAYQPEAGSFYGTSVLLGCYSPWADKWLNGGSLDVRRLFMHKDAYGGADMGYPPGTTDIDGKGEVPNRDIAQQIVEQLQAGGVTTRPSVIDPKTGKELWPLQRAVVPANPAHILQYPKDLDAEILNGMEIPDDIITAEQSGAWQGKTVPMAAFYSGLTKWLTSLSTRCIIPQILDYLVQLNFGPQEYEIDYKPLATQAMEEQGNARNQGGSPGAAPGAVPGLPPGAQRFSLEEEVGRGVLDAARVVQAGREIVGACTSGYDYDGETRRKLGLARRFVRMAKDAQGHEHKGKGEGGGQFTAQPGGKGEQASASPAKRNTVSDGGGGRFGITEEDWHDWTSDSELVNDALAGTLQSGARDSNGAKIGEEEMQEYRELAQKLQQAASNTVLSVGRAFRGERHESMEEIKRLYPPGKTVPLSRLTAVTAEQDIAEAYADANAEFTGGVRVLVRYQNANGELPGVQTNPLGVPSAEAVMPVGAKFRVARTFQDENGTVIVDMYSTEKYAKGLPRRPFTAEGTEAPRRANENRKNDTGEFDDE